MQDLAKTTPEYGKLPEKVSIDDAACKKMDELTKKSIDGSGNSSEHAGTLVTDDATGGLEVVNEKGGNSGDSTPSTTAPSGKTYHGTFHTHPYGKNDGAAFDGATASFSGGDFATLDDYNEDVSIVQSNDTKYVLVKTGQTPANIDDAAAEAAWQAEFDKQYADAKSAGKSDKEAMKIASEAAAKKTAEKYKLGYYEGTDCSNLSRVSP